MSAHAQLSPSKRNRWALCPGSIREEAKYPEQSGGTAAIDGTHTHTLLEVCLKDGDVDASFHIGVEMEDHEGLFVVDKERAARVQVALDYIDKRTSEGNMTLLSESKVDPAFLLGRIDLSGAGTLHRGLGPSATRPRHHTSAGHGGGYHARAGCLALDAGGGFYHRKSSSEPHRCR